MRLGGAVRRALVAVLALATGLLAPGGASAEDGYDLWLRYRPVAAREAAPYRAAATQIVAPSVASPTIEAAQRELSVGLEGLLGRDIPVTDSATRSGAIVLGTPASSPLIGALDLDLSAIGREGFVIRSARVNGRRATVIAANEDVGALYGAFHLLRLIQTRQPLDELDIASAPRVMLRTLNHWDNIDGTIERGFAGHSIFDWHKLPDWVDPRMIAYARANASIGINGVVPTNVGANATFLTPFYLHKLAALADTFRPYGIKVYLTARFSAPIEIGGMATADPRDAAVRAWWRVKADEIYAIIPDFGGFLVKANSEGQPGPGDYGRSHAEGANMLAEALGPHGGVVMWRAFIYQTEDTSDRHTQPYREFVPTDAQFLDNVVVQAKNGAIDFQPREPFHPLFGAMRATPVTLELQITKEYLGFATHLAYLGTMWREVLDADTYVEGEGSTVARVVDGSLFHSGLSGMAGVSNIGTDRNWTGSHFDQANWYAFGRLAWDHQLSAEDIAREWTRMTFTNDPAFVEPVVGMMMGSREAVVNYMTPLGLGHLMATGHHYGPGPWVSDLARAEWNPVYYHRADGAGIGFDRTATGSNAIAQYAPPVAAQFANVETTPEKFLLWFHHVSWDHRMASGRTLWDELVARYTLGVEQVREMRATWARLEGMIDAERYEQTGAFLAIQENEAQWWRDACLAYFQSISQRPFAEGYAPPPDSLDHYKAVSIPYAPGRPGVTAAPFRYSGAAAATAP